MLGWEPVPGLVTTCLLIFIAAQSTFRLNPALAPDLGRVPGMTAAAEVEQNHAEAVDPYLTELLLGALLIGATTLSRRPRVDGHVPAR